MGREGEKTQLPPGENALAKHPATRAARTWEPTEPAPLWSTETLTLSGLDLGRALQPRAASDSSQQSSLQPEQCRRGKHTRASGGKPRVGETLRALPTQASEICLPCSSLPTAQLNKGA